MDSSRVVVLARESAVIHELMDGLAQRGYSCTLVSSEEELETGETIDLLLIEAGNGLAGSALKHLTRRIKKDLHVLIILLIDKETLAGTENNANVEDFVLKPYNVNELVVRIKRLLKENKTGEEPAEYLRSGDILIDLARCTVAVAGRVIDLTFTEYELLKFLVSQKGHVFTREVLLNKIWGYDYFGGERTVDVHIARLRSKIEDPTHNFIETVRNIGYRIKADNE